MSANTIGLLVLVGYVILIETSSLFVVWKIKVPTFDDHEKYLKIVCDMLLAIPCVGSVISSVLFLLFSTTKNLIAIIVINAAINYMASVLVFMTLESMVGFKYRKHISSWGRHKRQVFVVGHKEWVKQFIVFLMLSIISLNVVRIIL